MKKFTFNLQALLTVREWETQRAQQRLGEANLRIAQIGGQLAEAMRSKDQMFEDWNAAARATFSVQDRLQSMNQAASLDRRLTELRLSLQSAQKSRSAAMDALAVATRGKKVVQNLKERRFEEYNAAVYRQELAEIEDMFNARRSDT